MWTNVGFYSLFAAYKGAKVFAFEPVSETYNLLLRNIKFYKAEKEIFPFKLAVGDTNKETLIKICRDLGGSTIIDSNFNGINGKSAYKGKEKIKVIRLDNFVEDKNLNRVDVIKIDTEGYELNVLKGAKIILENLNLK